MGGAGVLTMPSSPFGVAATVAVGFVAASGLALMALCDVSDDLMFATPLGV